MTVTGAATVSPRTVTTDVQGRYEVDALPAGRYLVTATLVGFDPQTISVDVTGDPAVVDLVLSLSPLSERVTVTATRTGAADIQTTPLAVTTLAAGTLDQMGIRTVEGLAGVVPSVTISQQNGAAQVTIRGIGTNSIVVGADPSSTVHLDGVYLGRPVMVLSDFLDVERVEVLRGPQGTLYGRNSVGGTINVVTRQPTNALDTSVRLTAGSYDTLRAEAAVSGPLVKDKVMGTVAFLRSGRDGFVRISIIPITGLAARTPGPVEGSCAWSWATRANCCCLATTAGSTGFPSPTPSRSPPNRDSATTAPAACGRCARAMKRRARIPSTALRHG